MFSLVDRTALVTGAGRGIGAGIADVLSEQGAQVVVNDLDRERADTTVARIRQAGGRAMASVFDVTDADAVRAAVDRIASDVGPIDILVNNAGIPAAGMPQLDFTATTPELWQRFVDLNLYGPLHCMHAVLPGMCERGHGRVVHISSEAGRVGLDIGVSLYGAAKAGAVGLVRHVAVEVAPHGVTVNSLSLGLIDNVAGDWADAVARTVPRRRLGSPRDVGAAVAFLASDEAGWITGQVLPVNGGAHAG
jgi:NAD(P)-dependent dehydrogenase (short-subunit alcohol dehydrogenase family)